MTERLGAVAYRHLAARAVLTGFGDGDSLQNIITDPLNDGCLCWVTEFSAYYVFIKDSVATPVGFFVIRPLAGPGRWHFFLAANDSQSFAAASLFVTPQSLPIAVAGDWVNPPAPGGVIYDVVTPGPDVFTIDQTTGFLTYQGPPAVYEVTVTASVANSVASADSVEVTTDTGGLVGSPVDDFFAARGVTPAVIDAEISLSSSKIFDALSPGQQLRPIFRNLTNANNLSIERLSWVVTQVR